MYNSSGRKNAWLLGGKEIGEGMMQREVGAAWKKDIFSLLNIFHVLSAMQKSLN